MKNAIVTIPFTGSIYVYVDDLDDSVTEDEAFEMAMGNIPNVYSKDFADQVHNIEYHKYANRGNVCVAKTPEFEIEFEEIEGDTSDGEIDDNRGNP